MEFMNKRMKVSYETSRKRPREWEVSQQRLDDRLKEDWFNAVKGNDMYTIKMLKVDYDMYNEDGATALIMACALGHVDMVKYLLTVANPNKPNTLGYTPLVVATMTGKPLIVGYLLNCPRVNVNGILSKSLLQIAGRRLTVADSNEQRRDICIISALIYDRKSDSPTILNRLNNGRGIIKQKY
jgi:hypothetical protein